VALTPAPALLVLLMVLAVALGLLAACQFVLPGLAARRVTEDLRGEGTVESVRVRAIPALMLLWGRAQAVEIRLTQMRLSAAQTGELLVRAGATADLDVWIGTLSEGPLVLRDVRLRKRGAQLQAEAGLSAADLQAALPRGFAVEPVPSDAGQLALRARASVLGVGMSVQAALSARDGALVVAPLGVPFAALVTLTLFSDPRVAVEGVGASAQAGGYLLTARARMRGS
jgi:hypothetical protein